MYILVYYQFNTRGAQYHHLLSLAYNYMSVLPLITHAAAHNTVQAGPSTGLDWDQNKPACMCVDPLWSEVSFAASLYCMPWWNFLAGCHEDAVLWASLGGSLFMFVFMRHACT